MAVIDTPTWAGSIDLGRVIGVCDQVATDVIDLDTIATFARRKNRRTPTRCVIGESTPTTFLTVVVKGRVKPNEHSLITAYKGPWASPEPRGIDDQPALDYWCKNALVWVPEQYEEEPFESTWREVLSKHQF